MATAHYRFGPFLLDPQARELHQDGRRIDLPLSTIDCLIHLVRHRDRPVGRDELAAVVWGRADVSEVSLSHAIMRLRKVLGDDGNAQRTIRTVPRHGYRWVMEVVEEIEAPAVAAATVAPAPPETIQSSPSTAHPDPPRAPQPRSALVLMTLLALLVAAGAWWTLRPAPQSPPTAATATAAIVLPADVDAGPAWDWLRFGLMDLVATQLRRGDVATTPSETVVALVASLGDAAADSPVIAAAALRVQPSASFAHERWTVRLEAQSGGRTLDVQARAADAIQAARSAADNLLIKLGHTPPSDDPGDAALARETLRQRINAAVLGGQLDIARALIRDAAPSLQADPEIALSRAKVEFFAGAYEACREQIETLLERLPEATHAGLRARALDTLGATALRQGRIDASQRAYAEAARLAEAADEPHTLAKAWLGLGGVASQRLQLEQAASAYGRARTLLDVAGDAFGVAAVDLNLGMNALQRGQPDAALPILRDAEQRFRALGAEDALGASLVAEVDAERALLEHAQALATSERFAALEARGANERQRWELGIARAGALVGVGRLAAADDLLARIADASDPAQDAIVRAQANVLAAEIALWRDDAAKAAELAGAARVPGLEARNRTDYLAAWLLHTRALQRMGEVEAARAEVARLREWIESGPASFGRVQLLMAEAAQADAEGDAMLALQRHALAMDAATARGVPEEMVAVALPYVRALIEEDRLDEAAAVNGRIARWADRDLRAAWSEALVYSALRQAEPAAAALERARVLAGERTLSDVITRR
jgi:DNA-binding winged helix-turn-helix (wHTH) protein/tetratricopeptide (TPR) repeat protein